MAAVLLFSALLLYDRPYLFCVMLFFVKLFGDWSLASSWGTVTDIGGRTSALVFAFNNSVAGIGEIVAPTMYGIVAENYDWKLVFIIAAVVYVLCAMSWLLVDCTIPIIGKRA